MSARNNPLPARQSPLLCYVTDRHSLPDVAAKGSSAALLQKIDQVAGAGVDWVQIREKDLPAQEIARLMREALQITARSSAGQRARVLVNDRVDVAIAEGVGGIHLGENSLPIAEAQRLIRSALKQAAGETFLTGVSCHSLEAAQAAERDGADYVFFGPVFATPSKEAFGPPQGTERLKEICRSLSIPVLAIGGITMENAESCMVAGAAGIAAIRLFQDAVDPISAIQRLRQLVSYHRPQLPGGQRIHGAIQSRRPR